MTLAPPTDYLRALPGDDVRQILWRFSDRYDLQMLVQSVRAVARGPVARLVAQGARNTHEWTPEKNALLQAFDESGITGVFMDPGQGGFIEGPKNLALPAAWPVAWRSPPSTNAAPPSSATTICPAAPPPSPARIASLGEAPSPSPSHSPTWASKPACSAAR
jgi:hypothetical protein